MVVESGFYPTEVVGRLRAPGQIEQWSNSIISPSGLKHHESGEYKANAKLALCGGFTAQKESGVVIDFGQSLVVESGFQTNMVVLTFNQGEVNSHPDSYFNNMVDDKTVGEFKAFNMRFWKGNMDAFTSIPTPEFYFRQSPAWERSYNLQIGGSGVAVVPSSMPTSANIYSKLTSDVFISGNFRELEFSKFIYLRGFFPSGAYELGTYGALGQGDFTFHFSYDYTDLNANISVPEDTDDNPIFVPQSLPNSLLPIGVSGHWKLNELSGTRYASTSGFSGLNMNLTAVNNPGASGGILNNAALFASGSSQTLSLASNNNFDLRNMDFAFAGWAYLDTVDGHMGIISKWEIFFTTQRADWALEYDNDRERFVFILRGAAGETAYAYYNILGKPQTNTWYFFVVQYNFSTRKLQLRINDLPIDSRILPRDDGVITYDSAADFRIGASRIRTAGGDTADDNRYWNGRIDSVTLWRGKTLTNTEQYDLYNNGAGLDYVFPSKRQPSLGTPSSDAGLKESLEAFWSMNEPSGATTWSDSAGNFHMSVQGSGALASTSGIIGVSRGSPSGAILFNSDDTTYLQRSDEDTLTFTNKEDFTIAGWIKLERTDIDSVIVSKWTGTGNQRHYRLWFDSAAQRFKFDVSPGTSFQINTATANSFGAPNTGIWYCIIGTFNHSTAHCRISVNAGTENESTNTYLPNSANTAVIRIGADDTLYADGHIDAVGIWRRILTDAERVQFYNNGNGREWSGM